MVHYVVSINGDLPTFWFSLTKETQPIVCDITTIECHWGLCTMGEVPVPIIACKTGWEWLSHLRPLGTGTHRPEVSGYLHTGCPKTVNLPKNLAFCIKNSQMFRFFFLRSRALQCIWTKDAIRLLNPKFVPKILAKECAPDFEDNAKRDALYSMKSYPDSSTR